MLDIPNVICGNYEININGFLVCTDDDDAYGDDDSDDVGTDVGILSVDKLGKIIIRAILVEKGSNYASFSKTLNLNVRCFFSEEFSACLV